MTWLRAVLGISTVIIFAVTFGAVAGSGFNWPRVFLGDLLAVDWRAQFNTDLVIHLALIGAWIAWREGPGIKGLVYGVFAVVWGGMFTFPYVLIASYRAGGDARRIVLGIHAGGPDARSPAVPPAAQR